MTFPDEVSPVAQALTHRPFRPSPRFAALLAGLILLPAGCGLSDYSGQMANEGALVRQWEEENKLLGEPLQMPVFPKKEGEKQAPSWNVFLRPPLGVSPTPVAQQGSKLTQMEGPLAKYTAKGNSFGLQYVYLGVGSDPKEFMAQVYNQFGAAAGGESSVPIPRSTVLLNGQEDLRPEITVKRKAFDNQQSHYSFNFYEHGKSAVVAVVYQMAKGAAGKEKEAVARAEPAIRASLATLGEGRDEVPLLRRAYASRNQGK
jgi:hypothetical protein